SAIAGELASKRRCADSDVAGPDVRAQASRIAHEIADPVGSPDLLITRAPWRNSIHALGQSETDVSTAARATMRLLARARSSWPACSTRTTLNVSSPHAISG